MCGLATNKLKDDVLPRLCSLDSRARWISSSSTCKKSMLSFSFSFSDFNLLFSGSSTPSVPIWKMTQVLFNFPFTARNKSHAAQAAWQIWVPFRHKAIVQLSASYHFPLNNKKRETKKQTHLEEGNLSFFLLFPLSAFSSCPEERRQYITYKAHNSWGHFYWQE